MDPLRVDSDQKLQLPVHNLQHSSPTQVKQDPATTRDISATVQTRIVSWSALHLFFQVSVTLWSQAACDFVGYITPTWVIAVYAILVITTGGLAWVVTQCLPQRPLWSMRHCPLNQAEQVLVKVGCVTPAGSAGMYDSWSL